MDDYRTAYYRVERMTPSTRKITDLTGVAAFLVEGTDRAALIDTCSGAGSLRTVVDSMTGKPVDVILTHGHCDHAGGAGGFDAVYLHPADWALVKEHASLKSRMGFVRACLPQNVFAGIPENTYTPERTGGWLPLRDGQVFDLGGIHLEILRVPGHTQGMCCVLNREERVILFGDACNTRTFLWSEEACCVEEYRENLKALKARENCYDTVWLSHGPTVCEKGLLDEVIAVCGRIMAGTNDPEPLTFMGNSLLLAERTDGANNRTDGKTGNIVYLPSKIFRP